jgi:PAS domain-containing protein
MEKNLAQSEKGYRNLFDSIDEVFCVIEMLFDENGKLNDFRYLEINPMFEQQTGLVNATGKTIGELAPSIEKSRIQ